MSEAVTEKIVASNPDPAFWSSRRVFLTGHTGFKGGWLALWLARLGAQVSCLALTPSTQPNLFSSARIGEVTQSRIGDIRDAGLVRDAMREAAPDIVFHLAAQPLVRASYKMPLETYATNVMGTAHVLDAMRDCDSVRAAVMITTDKVYRNFEQPLPYREDDALGGHDPYSASKAASEIVIASYRDAFLNARDVAVASARAGNVIGGGDWSEDRLIPDAVRAWSSGATLQIRRPQAIRPWQHVLEPLCAYLKLAEKLHARPALAGAYNFGPLTHEAASVRDVIAIARASYGRGEVEFGDGRDGPHEAGWLSLEIAKARACLDVAPRWHLEQSVARTMQWYRAQASGMEARALCEADIAAYEGGA